ncbi:DUF6957 family protein [Pseudomonas putida]|uniref:DUF6957 domain-containing protein n=1 Tax=Pseudomonas putida TaxID=303 RepID=A0A8I1EIF8_PSEPU|nr:hypothetical protein [Pseudomonas putida]MBI6885768.1 hypothetical protein [Pseudomonas putida]
MSDLKDAGALDGASTIKLSPAVENQLHKINSFLHDEGEPLMGCELTEDEAVELALKYFPGKPYCLVSHWYKVDLDISDADAAAVRSQGCEPVLVYGGKVLRDSHRRFVRGNWVRSTLQVSFTHGCLFQTPNTVYVLMGEGSVKKEKPEVIGAIF